ncbi:major capsid protein [Pseudomonas gingeri]|uniref:major capsid protein n=1 Tax=Pseudomonas gingeri TaxID=117681 RepID=UPI0015BED1F1|nr:major capsid protein [Pseudomonas gingeri]NWD49025.1 major capsid protein [Pseudomonas gingeri]
MADLSIFQGDEFGRIAMTTAINQPVEGQAVPTTLDALFAEEGVTTTAVFIEREKDSLTLVPSAERGAPSDPTTGPRRDMIPFQTIHLPTNSVIRADEVQGIRAFGSESELETVQALVEKRLQKMRDRLDATIRYQRAGVLSGKVFDADGTRVILDLYARFDIQQQTVPFTMSASETKLIQKVTDAKRKAEDVVGGTGIIQGWLGVCGRNWFDAFTNHDSIQKAYDRWADGQFLRTDNRSGFSFAGVNWEEFYGRVGEVNFIDPDVAYLVPVGVRGLFITNYAPADYMETVNTTGVPYYASQEPLPHNKGVDLEAQSNPLSLCTMPRAIIKLTK